MSKWINIWNSPDYQEHKIKNFNVVDNFLKIPPTQILDIGCGYAFESEMFQKKYNSNLFLLDSSIENTKNISRQTNYGTSDNFSFYHRINELTESYDERKMNYTFIDANNLTNLNNTKFDVIYSFLSCGFHYPSNTYKEFIRNHSDANSFIILDLRKKHLNQQLADIDIINIVAEYPKHITAQIAFK